MKKKGISAVVATVLIILITVAAVTIIWAAIIPMINEQLGKGTICLDAVSQLTLENKGYTCIDTATNQLKIQIGHGAADFPLADVQVLISEAGSTESISLIGLAAYDESNLPKANEEKTFVILDTETTMSNANIQEVSIAPIVTVGGTTEACDALAPVVIKAC